MTQYRKFRTKKLMMEVSYRRLNKFRYSIYGRDDYSSSSGEINKEEVNEDKGLLLMLKIITGEFEASI